MLEQVCGRWGIIFFLSKTRVLPVVEALNDVADAFTGFIFFVTELTAKVFTKLFLAIGLLIVAALLFTLPSIGSFFLVSLMGDDKTLFGELEQSESIKLLDVATFACFFPAGPLLLNILKFTLTESRRDPLIFAGP